MNKGDSYTGYDNEENMKLFMEFLSFLENEYEFVDGKWQDRNTGEVEKRANLFWNFMKTKVIN